MGVTTSPPPPGKLVRYLVIPVIGEIKEIRHTHPRSDRLYGWLKTTIGEQFDEPFERVNVLYRNEYRDMFVGETSAINGRHIRNIRATEIYRNNALANRWADDPESLPAISGPAVLFLDYQVWK